MIIALDPQGELGLWHICTETEIPPAPIEMLVHGVCGHEFIATRMQHAAMTPELRDRLCFGCRGRVEKVAVIT